MALSPEGTYLAYSDKNGVHVRSMQTADSRLLPDTKGMFIQWWAADGSQFFAVKPLNGQLAVSSMSLPGGVPHSLGDELPSPGGQYSLVLVDGRLVVKRKADDKIYSLNRKGIEGSWSAWSPHDKRLALVFFKTEGRQSWIESIDPKTGRWATAVSPQQNDIDGIAWQSESQLLYVKREPAPRTDTNLWAINIDPLPGRPLGEPQRRTRWTDFQIAGLSLEADSRRLCF